MQDQAVALLIHKQAWPLRSNELPPSRNRGSKPGGAGRAAPERGGFALHPGCGTSRGQAGGGLGSIAPVEVPRRHLQYGVGGVSKQRSLIGPRSASFPLLRGTSVVCRCGRLDLPAGPSVTISPLILSFSSGGTPRRSLQLNLGLKIGQGGIKAQLIEESHA